MTSRAKCWEMFLTSAGFLKEVQADLYGVAIAKLAVSMSSSRCLYFHNGPSYRRDAARDYTGGAAILSRERPGALLAPSHGPLISS